MYEHIKGLVTAPVCPMTADGEINYSIIEKYAPFLARNGLAGAFVNGTTGESMSLTTEERIKTAEKWIDAAPEGFRIIVHTGHTCLKDTQTLAAHAQKIGAHAIAAMPPFFFKPANVETLVDFTAQIAASAPGLPFYYYHIPSMTGVNVDMSEFFSLANEKIPNLAGMKFTHENLMDLKRCLDFKNGKYNIMFGRDEILLAGLAIGCTAAVGSTYNFAAPLYLKIIEAFNNADLDTANSLQAKSIRIVDTMKATKCFLTAIKSVMTMLGIETGPPRKPLTAFTKQDHDKLKQNLENIGFFEYASK